ncbi:hypothetical protein Tco_1565703 [Tanacetum coccineum]
MEKTSLTSKVCVALVIATDGVKKTSFLEMESSGNVVYQVYLDRQGQGLKIRVEERMIETLVKFNGDIRHHSGKAIEVANTLSQKG